MNELLEFIDARGAVIHGLLLGILVIGLATAAYCLIEEYDE